MRQIYYHNRMDRMSLHVCALLSADQPSPEVKPDRDARCGIPDPVGESSSTCEPHPRTIRHVFSSSWISMGAHMTARQEQRVHGQGTGRRCGRDPRRRDPDPDSVAWVDRRLLPPLLSFTCTLHGI